MKQKITSDNSALFSIEHNYEQPTLCHRATITVFQVFGKCPFSRNRRCIKKPNHSGIWVPAGRRAGRVYW